MVNKLWSTPKAEFKDAFSNRHKDSFVIFFDFSNETKIHSAFNIIISFLFELHNIWTTNLLIDFYWLTWLDTLTYKCDEKKMEIHLVLLLVYMNRNLRFIVGFISYASLEWLFEIWYLTYDNV